MDEGDHDMTHDADYAALVGIDWADTKHDFCLRATGSEQEEYGVMGSMPEEIDQWARGLADRFPGGKIAVCLEQSKGSLIWTSGRIRTEIYGFDLKSRFFNKIQ
jgi:hypothetical protein